MTQFFTAFTVRGLQRLVKPHAISTNWLAANIGVPQVTLSRMSAPEGGTASGLSATGRDDHVHHRPTSVSQIDGRMTTPSTAPYRT